MEPVFNRDDIVKSFPQEATTCCSGGWWHHMKNGDVWFERKKSGKAVLVGNVNSECESEVVE